MKKKCSRSDCIIILCAVGQSSREEIFFTEQSYILCAVGQCSREEKMFTEQSYHTYGSRCIIIGFGQGPQHQLCNTSPILLSTHLESRERQGSYYYRSFSNYSDDMKNLIS